ncbi:MAG: hypothetical protein LBD22_06300 [Spirochaetaceae bacterium]|jgi:YbbR domain-containing protein|nr:hypothetical protein [Spirochaetaceae bacterium]
MNARNFLEKITVNWHAKVLALVMAIFLYIFQQLNGMTSVRFDIPLSQKNNSELTPTAPLPSKVRVTIKGMHQNINALTESDIMARIDLSNYDKPGVYNIPVQITGTGEPHTIDSFDVSVTPGEIHLTLDKRGGKYFTVEASLHGEVAPGYELVQYSVMPKQVYIEGPAGMLEQLASIRTESIDLAARDSSFTRNVRVIDIDPSMTIHEQTIQFNATISSIELAKEYNDVPISIINLNEELTITTPPGTGTARLQGNELIVKEWTLPEQFLTLDCAQISAPGEYVLPVSVHAPETISVLEYTPETIAVIVRKVR